MFWIRVVQETGVEEDVDAEGSPLVVQDHPPLEEAWAACRIHSTARGPHSVLYS